MTVVDGSGNIPSGIIKSYTAKSLAEYIERLGLIKAKNDLCFRGLSKSSYRLVPSLDRGISKEEPLRKWSEQEYNLVEFAEQRFPDSFVKQTPALLVANMQHYGIPTRMMDLTGNALVALFFACEKEDNEDGQVIVFDEKTVSAYNPYVNVIADTYRLTKNAPMEIETYRYIVYKQQYFSSMIYPGWENDNNGIDDVNLDLLKRPIIVDVGSLNQRQINQSGKFIVFPNSFYKDKNGKEYISNHLIKMEKNSDFIKAIINIPKDSKKKIIDKLKLAGITKDFLFPDNTDAVCESIKQSVQNRIYYINN